MAHKPMLGMTLPQVTVGTSLNFSSVTPKYLHPISVTPKICIFLSSIQYVFQILAQRRPSGHFAPLRTFCTSSRLSITVEVTNKMQNRRKLLLPSNIQQASLISLTALSSLEAWEMASQLHPTCPISYARYNQRTGRSSP